VLASRLLVDKSAQNRTARQSDVRDEAKVEGHGASAWRALEAPMLRNKRG
jgi:hypothetical protein